MPEVDLYPQFDSNAGPILGTALVVAIFMNLIPSLSYPFYLLFAMIHELGHVFMTRFSGGEVTGFWVYPNTTGVAVRKGGDHYLVIPAGYVGTSLFSAGLVLLTGLTSLAPYILGVLGGLLILFVFLYTRRYSAGANYPRTSVTAIVGLAFGVLFIGIAWLAQPYWSIFLLNLLAIQGAFTSMQLLAELAEQVRQAMKDIDPDQMAKLAGCSPMFWVRVWSLLSFLILGAAVWFAWLRNLPLLLNNG